MRQNADVCRFSLKRPCAEAPRIIRHKKQIILPLFFMFIIFASAVSEKVGRNARRLVAAVSQAQLR